MFRFTKIALVGLIGYVSASKSVVVSDSTSFTLSNTTQITTAITAFSGALSTAWSSMQGILSAFKTTNKDTLVQTMTDQGYKTFMDKTTVGVTQGIPHKYWPTFLSHMSTNLMLPPGQLLTFQNYLMDVQYVNSDDWSALDATFSIQNGATCNYIMACTNYNFTDDSYSWLHANVQAAFTLMPNIFVISHEHSSFFSEKVTLQFVEKPAGLKVENFEPIFAFLKIIAFKQIGQMIGLDLPLK